MYPEKRSQKQKFGWKSKLFLFFGIIILVLVVINLSRSWQQSRQVNQEITGLEQNIENLTQDNAELKELIKYFNSTAYIEEKARLDLGLKKEGEKVVIITDPTKKEINETGPDVKRRKEIISNPQKWWQYFFK